MSLEEFVTLGDPLATTGANRLDRYYRLSFLWWKDHRKADVYWETLRTVMASYGASYEQQFAPELVIANGVEKPNGITLAHFPNLRAFIDFQHDERLRKYSSLRDASFRSASIEGRCTSEGNLSWELRKREYLIEVARPSSDPDAYERYVKDVAPVLARYGYRVERVLKPEFTSGLPFRAGLVKIACFDFASGFERLQSDPDFQELMNRYRNATRDFMWAVGKLADVTLKPSKIFS